MNYDILFNNNILINRLFQKFNITNYNLIKINNLKKYKNKNFKQILIQLTLLLEKNNKFSQIPKVYNLIKKIKEKNSNFESILEIFIFLSNLKNNQFFKNEQIFKSNFEFYNKNIPSNIINILYGLENEDFKWSTKYQKFIYNKDKFSNINFICKKVSEIGTMIKFLENQYQNSIFFNQSNNIIKKVLIKYFNFINNIESNFNKYTLIQFNELIHSNHINEIISLTLIIFNINNLKGGKLYNKLLSLTKHGNKVISNFSYLIIKEINLIIKEMIINWMYL